MSDADSASEGSGHSSQDNHESNDDAVGNSANATQHASSSSVRMPKLICFDLDYTLWPLWVDTHVSPPIKRKKAEDVNKVYDRYGQSMSFYRDVPGILLELKQHPDVHVAVASRTSAPDAAAQALDQLLIPSSSKTLGSKISSSSLSSSDSLMRAMECFNTKEIYPGSKLRHFKEIHRKTKIPYEEMVFFDDESRNREVATLGVTFVLVPEGVDRRIFEKGINDWRHSRARAEGGTSDHQQWHVPSSSGEVFVERRGGGGEKGGGGGKKKR